MSRLLYYYRDTMPVYGKILLLSLLIGASAYQDSPKRYRQANIHLRQEKDRNVITFQQRSRYTQSETISEVVGKSDDQCTFSSASEKFDCAPHITISEPTCVLRGCCWHKFGNLLGGIPYCFYPKNFVGYKINAVITTPYGYRADMSRFAPSGEWPKEIQDLRLDVYLESKYQIHFKVCI